jgi:catechol-2,3-dioxygenase
MNLNHINLTVGDVAGLANLFERCFGFRVTERRGNGNFAVLKGENGFVLILMYGKDEAQTHYPALFHIGFLVASAAEVEAAWQRVSSLGHNPPSPAILNRGGGKTYGFYYAAPGGIVIEVSAPAKTPKEEAAKRPAFTASLVSDL